MIKMTGFYESGANNRILHHGNHEDLILGTLGNAKQFNSEYDDILYGILMVYRNSKTIIYLSVTLNYMMRLAKNYNLNESISWIRVASSAANLLRSIQRYLELMHLISYVTASAMNYKSWDNIRSPLALKVYL